jgi:branched-chain amino acid aminotransferase
MLHRYITHNGRRMPIEEARLSPGQGGLLSGWGLFSTLRITQGVPFAFERHWDRLRKDSERTRCPFPFDRETVRGELLDLIRANEFEEGTARIYAIQNRTGFYRSEETFPEVDLLLCTAGLPAYREPARLGLRKDGRHAASPLAGVKVTSWLMNVWCLQEAQREGHDEVVLLNERGEVAECTAANIFVARGKRVFTPPLSSGCLEGITRSVLLEISGAAGYPAEERVLFPEDLYGADEVFISSTNRNLLSVGEVAGHRKEPAPGPVVRQLEAAFLRYIADYVARNNIRAARGQNGPEPAGNAGKIRANAAPQGEFSSGGKKA